MFCSGGELSSEMSVLIFFKDLSYCCTATTAHRTTSALTPDNNFGQKYFVQFIFGQNTFGHF